ncbi:MAG: ATP-dependent helicase RecQ, partial [Enterococcus sp.]|nr:ATP-dependent helicase RecQ [Enterococcus sp.]
KQAICCDNHGPFDYQLLIKSKIQNEKIASWQDVLLKIF